MGVTSTGIPYPENTDPVTAGAQNMAAIAHAVADRSAVFTAATLTGPIALPPAGYAPPGFRRTADGWVILEGDLYTTGPIGNVTLWTGLPVAAVPLSRDYPAFANMPSLTICRLKLTCTATTTTLSYAGGSQALTSGGLMSVSHIIYYAGT